VYVTNAKGIPAANPLQHLSFNFVHSVNTFLADSNGKFAYAGLTWYDNQSSTGDLISTATLPDQGSVGGATATLP